jgi:hypothetical protein
MIFCARVGYLLMLEFTNRANWVECKGIDDEWLTADEIIQSVVWYGYLEKYSCLDISGSNLLSANKSNLSVLGIFGDRMIYLVSIWH